jgi:hypothetical protein
MKRKLLIVDILFLSAMVCFYELSYLRRTVMKRVAIIGVMLLMTLFVVGCNDQNAPTAVPQSTPVVASSLAKGGPPANSGPIVVRYEDGAYFFVEDTERQLVSVHTTFNGFFCQPSTVFELVDFQHAFTPTGAVRSIIKGETFVRVYGPANFDDVFSNFCDFIRNGPRLAEGTANLVYHDNNYVVWPPPGPGANAAGIESNGKLQLVGSDGEVSYHLNVQGLVKPDGSVTFVVQNINLTY